MNDNKTKTNLTDEQLDDANGGVSNGSPEIISMYCICGARWEGKINSRCPRCGAAAGTKPTPPKHGEGSGIK
ncbi:hypothetical protein LJC56_01450 [Christensenellaceae bacterium OttesenSCG-928-K19]|nr:hypothetical protein [Christensenellaceae bacterium OttesenSCG-928-K19]